jgi:hypothetical protein
MIDAKHTKIPLRWLILIFTILFSQKSNFAECSVFYADEFQDQILNSHQECLLHNQGYSFDYLSFKPNPNGDTTVLTRSLQKVKNFETLRWHLARANDSSERIYYMRPLHSDDMYLCAMNRFGDLFRMTRKINLKRFDQARLPSECKWSIERTRSLKSKNAQKIRNVKYDDYLYAAFSLDPRGRGVYLWKSTNSWGKDSDSFIWLVDCTSGHFLIQ